MNKKMVTALAGGALALACVIPGLALAAGSGAQSAVVNRQLVTWRDAPVSTVSRSFLQLTGLSGRICDAGAFSASVSVYGAGAPMQLQVHIDGGALMAPGAVTFSPGPGSTIGTFTFVGNAQPFEANDHHLYEVEWRSLTGHPTTITSATMTLLFQRGTHTC
jgi:hypothetical protein